jgi:hypothetical protein
MSNEDAVPTKRFLYSAGIESAAGWQTFYIDAHTREEADDRAAKHDTDGIYAEEVSVEDLGRLVFDNETSVTDFGDYPPSIAPTAEQAEGVRVITADDADMVWPDYDTETFHHSIDEAVEYEVDQAWPVNGELELKVQLAKRIPNATIRIFNITENGHDWEIVAAPAASTGEQA